MADTTRQIDLTKEFLDSIRQKTLNYWRDNKITNEWDCERTIKGYGCLKNTHFLNETPKGNLSFVLYNFLGLFNGHYEFIVNPTTFEWKMRKYGDYCTFTEILPTDDTTIYTKDNLSKEQIIEIEGHIANTLYFVFYSEFKRNCGVNSTAWQEWIYKRVAEDF